MSGWVYGGGGTTTPGGSNKDVQFNNNGSFSGSALLTTDGSGSLSASTHVSASTFYGDGSNLTGLTASAVNVADGPEFSIQFRRDSPVTGEISGNVLLMSDGAGAISASSNVSASNFYLPPGKSIFFDAGTDTFKITNNGTNLDINGANIILNAATQVSASSNLSASNLYSTTLNLTSDAVVQGQVKVGPGTGVGYVASNGDPDTRIRFGAAGRGSDSISIEAGGKSFIVLDENGTDELILGAASSDVVFVSGSLTASVGMRVSASAAIGEDIFVGSGNTRTIGVLQDSGDDFFVIGQDDGNITLSASSGVEFVASTTAGVSAFGCPINVYDDQAGSNKVVELSKAGDISGSGNISGSNLYIKDVIQHIGDPDTKITFGADDINLTVAGKTAIDITYDGSGGGDTREITFNEGHEDIDVRIEGDADTHLFFTDAGNDRVGIGIASPQTKLHVSSSTANGNDIFVGSGTTRSIGVLQDSGADFFVMGNDDGAVTLSASSGVEFVASTSDGVGAFGCPITVFADQEGNESVISLAKSGNISGSGDLTAKGKVTFGVSPEQTTKFSASVVGNFRTYIVNSTGSVITGTLPGVNSYADVGLTYTFKDIAGSGSTNDIVIEASGSQKIDGASAAKIGTDYGALTLTAFSSSMGGFGWGIVSST